tara:strand:+ start:1013 stop:1594 length:582 start_codon:yes stop_codon:yes gene_type:complete
MQIKQTIQIYLKERQTPVIRIFHIVVLLLVLAQIILSNVVDFNDNGTISSNVFEFYGTWAHIVTGLLLVPLAVIFIVIEFKKHGFKHFYPYLSGDNQQVKADFVQLKQLQLPEAESKGIAAIVQGLGLGALVLVLLSGSIWFYAWTNGASWAEDVQEIHGLLTGLIITYSFAHGLLGLWHIFYSAYKAKQTTI